MISLTKGLPAREFDIHEEAWYEGHSSTKQERKDQVILLIFDLFVEFYSEKSLVSWYPRIYLLCLQLRISCSNQQICTYFVFLYQAYIKDSFPINITYIRHIILIYRRARKMSWWWSSVAVAARVFFCIDYTNLFIIYVHV